MKLKSLFFEKINKTDKPLVRLTKGCWGWWRGGSEVKSIKLEMKKKLQWMPQKYKE